VKKRGGVLDVLPCCFFDNRIGICGICGINFIGGHFVFLAKIFKLVSVTGLSKFKIQRGPAWSNKGTNVLFRPIRSRHVTFSQSALRIDFDRSTSRDQFQPISENAGMTFFARFRF